MRPDDAIGSSVLRLEAGEPYPLGATWTGDGVNFAVFSAHATRVELCLFDSSGRNELSRVDLPEFTDEVWHGYLPGGEPGLVYGYRVHGPYLPEEGHRFNPNKLLLDPYATELVGRLKWRPSIFGYELNSKKRGFSRSDSASSVMKARVNVPIVRPLPRPGPKVPWAQTVIYELHVRGFTRQHPGVPAQLRGSFAGLATPAVIAHLKALGITSVELLPVHAFVDDDYLTDKGLRNYWGYNSIAFFALESRYLSGGNRSEFRDMVARLHDAGLEVILDVVYNHTAEGNELGPTLSFKGFDNASYYRLNPADRRFYINDTGTGNTLNASHPRVVQLILDSLRYWVTQMGVDGFRFDLATILGREDNGFNGSSGFLNACCQDPILNRVKLIADRSIRPNRAAIRSALFRPAGANGTIVSVTTCVPSGAATKHRQPPWQRASRRRPTTSTTTAGVVGQRQLHHRARRFHAARSRLLRQQAQRGERRGEPRRARRKPLVELRRRRSNRGRRDLRVARAPETQPAGDADFFPRHANAARRRRNGAQPAR